MFVLAVMDQFIVGQINQVDMKSGFSFISHLPKKSDQSIKSVTVANKIIQNTFYVKN